jgi:hypothetical protein
MKDYVVEGKVIVATLDDGKVVKMSTDFIRKMQNSLGIDEEDAVLTWLEDEEYLINDEQEELIAETKKYKVKADRDVNKPKAKREVVKKEDPEKTMVISEIAKLLPNFAQDIVIENDTKLITFRIGDNEYKLDLIKKRKKAQ